MNAERGARVVVGVDRSPQGLAALRAAAAQAARRGAPLHAVRVEALWSDSDTKQIDAAFKDAFGGVPAGLTVLRSIQPPPVASALAEYADGPEDLLVIGSSGRGLWHALWSGSVPLACIRKARCELLVVPPPPLARELRGRRRWRRRQPDLWSRFEHETAANRG